MKLYELTKTEPIGKISAHFAKNLENFLVKNRLNDEP